MRHTTVFSSIYTFPPHSSLNFRLLYLSPACMHFAQCWAEIHHLLFFSSRPRDRSVKNVLTLSILYN